MIIALYKSTFTIPYLEDLAVLGAPVGPAAVPPGDTKLSPAAVQPAQAADSAAVDLCFEERPQSLSAHVFTSHHPTTGYMSNHTT